MIAIVGAGITGLYLAKLLRDQGADVHLFEARDKVGGNIGSIRDGAYLFETGPNSIRMNEAFHHLLSDLKLLDEVVYTSPKAKKRYVLKDGTYRPIPMGPLSLLFGPFFRFREVRRILKERKLPPEEVPRETVDAFFRRRFGDPVTDYLVAPFISGIYAGDPQKLLVAKAFPRIVAWEKEFGSVLKGFFKGREKSKYKGIFSLREGLGQMTEAMGQQLGQHLHLNHSLQALRKTESGWELDFGTGKVSAQQVVLAMPAQAIGELLAQIDPEGAEALTQVTCPPVTVVQSVYDRKAVGHALDGFGALHNHLEPSETLGTIFSSSIFPNRCPEDEVLLTTFVGGARFPERAQLSEEVLTDLVHKDLSHYLKISEPPKKVHLVRWPRAIPQYDPAILAAHATASRLSADKLWLAGNWTHGISVPSCLERAQELCEQLTASPASNSVI